MSPKKWFYISPALDKVGPISSQALKALANQGIIKRKTTLISEDGERVFEAGTIQGLFDSAPTEATASRTPEPARPAAPAPQPTAAPQQTAPPFPIAPFDPYSSSISNLPFEQSGIIQATPVLMGYYQPVSSARPTHFPVGLIVLLASLAAFLAGALIYTSVTNMRSTARSKAPALASAESKKASASQPEPSKPAPRPSSSGSSKTSSAGSEKQDHARKRVRELMEQERDPSVREEFAHSALRRPSHFTGNDLFARRRQDVPDSPPADPKRPAGSGAPAEKKADPGKRNDRVPQRGTESRPDGATERGRNRSETAAEPMYPSPRNDTASTGAPAERTRDLSTEELVTAVERSVALIKGKDGNGTGFVVRDGILATNSHVIASEEIRALEIRFPSEAGTRRGPFKAKLLYEDRDRDLAFLSFSPRLHAPLPVVQNYRFRRAQDVIVIGNPGRGDGEVLENAISKGIISTETVIEDQSYYQLSIAVNPGNSGGPVLDLRGNVLGVVTLKASKNEAMAYCIPPADLLKALDALDENDTESIRLHRERHTAYIPLNRAQSRLALLVSDEVPKSAQAEFIRETIRLYDEAVRRLPNEAVAFLGRGLLKMFLEDIDGALADFEKAAELAPDKKEFVEARDKAREWARASRASGRVMVFQIPGFGGDPGEDGQLSQQQRLLIAARYQQILNKSIWRLQNGQEIRGKIVGFEDGIAEFRPTKGGPPVKRYARLFIEQDKNDIHFYARYNNLPLETGPRRWR